MALGDLFLDTCILASDIAIGATFAVVFQKLIKSRSAAGLSLQTLIALVSARSLHLLSHPLALHFTPSVLPKLLFSFIDVVNAFAGLACLWFFVTYLYSTYESEKDNFAIQIIDMLNLVPKSGPFKHRPVAAASLLYFIVAVAAFLWYLVRSGPSSFASAYFICFYEALYAIALLPQLWMFHKDKCVPSLLATFVVLVAIGRVCTLTFWASYPLVRAWPSPANRSIQMYSEIVNLLILSDFLYYWAKSKLRGDKDIVLGNDCDYYV